MRLEYVIGVDLGQAHDYTAVAVLERELRPTGRMLKRYAYGGGSELVPELEATYKVRHLERFPLGTAYPLQVERVKELTHATQRLRLRNGERATVRLVVDQTGVGRPVVDMLKKAGLRNLTPVTIHGGDQTVRAWPSYRVPKRELVSVLQVLLQTKRLKVAGALELAQTLQREMLAFKVEISKSGHDTYGNDWRQNPHDDLVLAVALASWISERMARAAL